MKIAVIGAGAAGLGAALRLREKGHEVVVFDRNDAAGGRCRSVYWRDAWRITGAFAFISAEQNLVDQAKSLGIYDALPRVDLTQTHEQTLLHKRKTHIKQRSFSVADILRNEAIPAREKLALAAAFPSLVKRVLGSDRDDPTAAAELDDETACGWFRRHSPAFVDYYLEPTFQMFCGYGEEDYSIAWMAWMLGGLQTAPAWWSFKDRGVGMLTHQMELALARDPGAALRLACDVRQARETEGGFEIAYEQAGRLHQESVDAAVVATPGAITAGLLPDLDAARRGFFDQVSYGGHHIMNLVVKPGDFPLPTKVLLPTADGFRIISNIGFIPRADGLWDVYGEMKGAFCRETAGASAESILDMAWAEACEANPQLASLEVVDRRLQRNDIAIMHVKVGYLRALKAFKALPPHPRLAFAGDYLFNSTVGSAHATGLEAAEQLSRSLAA